MLFLAAESYLQEVPGYGWACSVCTTYSSAVKANVVRHVQGLHLASKDLLCPFCDKAFATNNNRGRHVKSRHGYALKPADIEDMLEKKRQKDAL